MLVQYLMDRCVKKKLIASQVLNATRAGAQAQPTFLLARPATDLAMRLAQYLAPMERALVTSTVNAPRVPPRELRTPQLAERATFA